jgi:hypothetical protein
MQTGWTLLCPLQDNIPLTYLVRGRVFYMGGAEKLAYRSFTYIVALPFGGISGKKTCLRAMLNNVACLWWGSL